MRLILIDKSYKNDSNTSVWQEYTIESSRGEDFLVFERRHAFSLGNVFLGSIFLHSGPRERAYSSA
jgi:hypothetical protein